MRGKTWLLLLLSACLASCAASEPREYQTPISSPTEKKLDDIFRTFVRPRKGQDHGEIINRVSAAFLGTAYRGGTLIGGPDVKEALVVNFSFVDCTTLIEYVEALSRSHDRETFLRNLVHIRYANDKVTYTSRRHFFSDWYSRQPRIARDVTAEISPDYVTVEKDLNRLPNGEPDLPGIGFTPRKLTYIPAAAINENVLHHLRTGDYVGIYSFGEQEDVSHVGIVVRHDGRVWFRNASSLPENEKVIDSPFLDYIRFKPGMIVIRAEQTGY
ncbi:N-acetylmuramoyl-L-alanine amidase-like domain-containing protein [Sorlinia euscelidii]